MNLDEKGVVYVCSIVGNDETGKGTVSHPFLSLVRAMQLDADAKFMVRKSTEEGFLEAAKSALKKAKGQIEIMEKKAKKKMEKDAMEQAAAAEEATKLEESKKIVLKEDSSLPTAHLVLNLLMKRLKSGKPFKQGMLENE